MVFTAIFIHIVVKERERERSGSQDRDLLKPMALELSSLSSATSLPGHSRHLCINLSCSICILWLYCWFLQLQINPATRAPSGTIASPPLRMTLFPAPSNVSAEGAAELVSLAL